ncbi:uncharacterized protein LOC127867414 [Dreissena polymorpha]|uniref:Uncharacterized protein n=1 Tax=Dreissena polymorpha TaxID=45954 RepID=A0A9D4LYA2_DREPO|nr:uncharacterized protein LOC127867414 [Dreissena polymorpha]KAH3866903.1 hypothetical protein DPMN_030026 [Dreissena polymorpha]
MPSWSGYANGAFLVTFAGGCLVVVGYVLPFWVTYDQYTCPVDKEVRLFAYVSVWYTMACKRGHSASCEIKGIQLSTNTSANLNFSSITGCTSAEFSTNLASKLDKNTYWWTIQIMTSFGLGLIFLAAIVLLYCKCAGVASRRLFVVTSLLLITGGSLFLSIVIIVAVALTSVFGIPDHKTEPETFPWSLLSSGIGSLFSLAGGVLSIVIVCWWTTDGIMFSKGDKDETLGETNIKMSETVAHPAGIHPWFTDGVQFYKGGDGQAFPGNRPLESGNLQRRNMYPADDTNMKPPHSYDLEKRSSFSDSDRRNDRTDTSQAFIYPGSRISQVDLSRSSNKERDISRGYFSNSKKYKGGEYEASQYSAPSGAYDDNRSRRFNEGQDRHIDEVSSKRSDGDRNRRFGEEQGRRFDDERYTRFDGYSNRALQDNRTQLLEQAI